MRTRTVREGSVGLLLLLGIGLFIGLILWLRGFQVGRNQYKFIIEFAKVGGLQEGAVVRYRGVNVGNVKAIRPGSNGVEVNVEVSPADLVIPNDVRVEANQSGFIGEFSVDITPNKSLPSGAIAAKPLDQNCDSSVIVCNGSRLKGDIGVSIDELIRYSTRFTSVYSQPQVYDNLNAAAKNASIAAGEVAQLARELGRLTKATQQQLNTFSATANSVQRAANQIGTSTNKTTNQLNTTIAQVNRLVTNLDSLVTTNRTSLVTTLNNISQTSEKLRSTVNTLTPTVNRVTQGELLKNLETLTANAVQASANLRDVSNALNNPANVLVLQQTLDSARVTFQNAQKITSDLDELTGDPTFRENVRQLVNGLSGLVSSTQQLQQQVQMAETLDSLKTDMNNPNFVEVVPPITKPPETSKRVDLPPTRPSIPTYAAPDWSNEYNFKVQSSLDPLRDLGVDARGGG